MRDGQEACGLGDVYKREVFLTRPRGGRYHYIGKHRYWMADNVLYDIVPMGKKGIQYIVIKVVK